MAVDYSFLDAPRPSHTPHPILPDRAPGGDSARAWAEFAAFYHASQLVPQAEAAASRAVEREPRSAAWRGYRGFLRTCLKYYAEAGEDLDAALALEPDDATLRRWRAEALYMQFRLEEALPDLAFFSGDRWVAQSQFRRGMILAIEGKQKEAAAVVAAFRARHEKSAHAWADLLDAVLAHYRGDHEAAVSSSKKALEADPPADDLSRVRLYHRIFKLKRHLAQRRPMTTAAKAAKDSAELLLMGIGMDPPQNLTLGAMEALERCDVVFVNVPGDTLVELLSLFCKKLLPINYRNEKDVDRCGAMVAAECKPGRVVGYVTMGHVMVFGALTNALMKHSAKTKVRCVAMPGVSLMDKMLASMGLILGHSFDGFSVFDARVFLEKDFVLDPSLPAGVYFSTSGTDARGKKLLAAMRERLLKSYPADHPCYLFAPQTWDRAPEKKPLRALLDGSEPIDSQVQLFIPPAARR